MAVGAGFNWFIAAGFVDRPTRPSARRKSGRFLRAPLRCQEGCTRWCRAGGAVAGRCCKKPNGQPQRGAGPKQPGDGSGGRCGLLRGRIAESRHKGIGTGEGCLPGLGQAGAVEKEIGLAIGVGHGAMIATRKSSCGRINPILNPSHCLYPNKDFLDQLIPAAHWLRLPLAGKAEIAATPTEGETAAFDIPSATASRHGEAVTFRNASGGQSGL